MTPSKQHFFTVTGLTLGNEYKAIAFCGSLDLATSTYLQTFYTLSGISDEIKERGICILGGIGYSNTALSQVDLYDPVDDTWYENVTSIPTARSYAGITYYNKKIYVFGGLIDENPTNVVEQFDPYTETWATMESMPTSLQGRPTQQRYWRQVRCILWIYKTRLKGHGQRKQVICQFLGLDTKP